MLTHKDSNLDKQLQKLLCYHYTMGQFCRFSSLTHRKSKTFSISYQKKLYN